MANKYFSKRFEGLFREGMLSDAEHAELQEAYNAKMIAVEQQRNSINPQQKFEDKELARQQLVFIRTILDDSENMQMEEQSKQVLQMISEILDSDLESIHLKNVDWDA